MSAINKIFNNYPEWIQGSSNDDDDLNDYLIHTRYPRFIGIVSIEEGALPALPIKCELDPSKYGLWFDSDKGYSVHHLVMLDRDVNWKDPEYLAILTKAIEAGLSHVIQFDIQSGFNEDFVHDFYSER